MKQRKLLVALAALPMMFAGCDVLDVLKADRLEAPSIPLTGRLVDPTGTPLPQAASNSPLRVWHTSWTLADTLQSPSSMAIHVKTDGSYSTLVYRGTYDLQLLSGNPWVNDTTRIPLVINGPTQHDVTVQPYQTIQEENFVFTPAAAGDTVMAGSITATFRVARHVTETAVDLVGLYVSTTAFVDRNRRETSLQGSWAYPVINAPTANPTPAGQLANNPQERRATEQLQTQLSANPSQLITITLWIPRALLLTPSPEPRRTLYARVGVKAVGVTQLVYSPVKPVTIVQ